MKELFERLENSEEYKKFKQEYPDSYFCTAFLVLGTPEEAKTQLNYAISDTEVMCFDMTPEKISPLKMKTVKAEKPEAVNKDDIKIDAEEAKSNIEKHAKKKFSKIIAVLQKLNGVLLWNVTCMEGFLITRFHVSAVDGKIEDLKGLNIRDMMKVEKRNPETGEIKETNFPKTDEEVKEVLGNKESPKEEPKPDYIQ
ncbi:hypothetical protein ACFLZZ_01010 [Nanoarchaeota archaeon]